MGRKADGGGKRSRSGGSVRTPPSILVSSPLMRIAHHNLLRQMYIPEYLANLKLKYFPGILLSSCLGSVGTNKHDDAFDPVWHRALLLPFMATTCLHFGACDSDD